MTEKELYKILISTGYPVAYHHFDKPPSIPFIVYFPDAESFHGSDIENYISATAFRVELYTERKNTVAELKLQKVLRFTEFEKTTVYIDSENLYQTAYSFETIQKIEEE